MNRMFIATASRLVSCAAVISLVSSSAVAQTLAVPSSQPAPPREVAAVDTSLATTIGHEVSVSAGGYSYTEPGTERISIHGGKIAGAYMNTLSPNRRRRWFVQSDVR